MYRRFMFMKKNVLRGLSAFMFMKKNVLRGLSAPALWLHVYTCV